MGFIYPEERLPKIRWKGKIVPILQLLQGFLARFIPGAEITKHKLLTVNIPDDSDVVIATYYETAFAIQAYPSPLGNKISISLFTELICRVREKIIGFEFPE